MDADEARKQALLSKAELDELRLQESRAIEERERAELDEFINLHIDEKMTQAHRCIDAASGKGKFKTTVSVFNTYYSDVFASDWLHLAHEIERRLQKKGYRAFATFWKHDSGVDDPGSCSVDVEVDWS